jgi:hypothetical protein
MINDVTLIIFQTIKQLHNLLIQAWWVLALLGLPFYTSILLLYLNVSFDCEISLTSDS